MKNLRFFNAIFLIAALLFVIGCGKNEMDNLDTQVAQSTEKVTLVDTPTGDAEDITDAFKMDANQAESRGINVLISSTDASVSVKSWRLYRYAKSALIKGYKYTAVVTPFSGDPDLYIYGYDIGNTSPWRIIRQSTSTVIDVASLTQNDLKSSEEYGYFAVYGYTAAKFNIKIYREDVCGKEDCIGFNTSTVHYKQEGDRYLITDGRSRMLIAPNKPEAAKIVKVIKTYGLNQQCFVGRPGASFTHYTKSGAAPVGAMNGEDCIGFNPETIEVKEVNGRWKIVDGNHWMFDFDKNKEEAEETFCIIKKYGYTKSCFVGRPNPSMTYMRK